MAGGARIAMPPCRPGYVDGRGNGLGIGRAANDVRRAGGDQNRVGRPGQAGGRNARWRKSNVARAEAVLPSARLSHEYRRRHWNDVPAQRARRPPVGHRAPGAYQRYRRRLLAVDLVYEAGGGCADLRQQPPGIHAQKDIRPASQHVPMAAANYETTVGRVRFGLPPIGWSSAVSRSAPVLDEAAAGGPSRSLQYLFDGASFDRIRTRRVRHEILRPAVAHLKKEDDHGAGQGSRERRAPAGRGFKSVPASRATDKFLPPGEAVDRPSSDMIKAATIAFAAMSASPPAPDAAAERRAARREHDHTILGWRGAIALMAETNGSAALPPNVQAMWCRAAGLNVWGTGHLPFLGHYARDGEAVQPAIPGPDANVNRFDGPGLEPAQDLLRGPCAHRGQAPSTTAWRG